MSRIGTCLQCGQRYGDIPDSLLATHVKCKSCGGVVEIPPVTAAPAAAPAIQATPAPLPPRAVSAAAAAPRIPVPMKPAFPTKPAVMPVKPAVPPRAPAAPIPAKPVPAPRPAVKPQPPAPAIPRPAPAAARPAAPPAPAKPDAAAILAAARAKREAGASAGSAEPKPSAAAILAAAKAKRGAATAAAPSPTKAAPARRARAEEEEDKGRTRHYRKSSNKGPMILVLVLVLASAGAGGMWWMVQQKAKREDAAKQANAGAPSVPVQPAQPAAALPTSAESVEQATPPAQAGGTAGGARTAPPTEDPTGAGDPVAAQAPPPQPEEPPATNESFEFKIPEPGQPLETVRDKVDPAKIRLDLVPPLAKWQGTDDAKWTEVQEDMALYLDNSGARSNRAGDRLITAGRHSFPAIVNAMMKQDYNTVEGVKMAGALNDLLGKIGKGTNLGWRSAELHPLGSAEWTDSVLFQKKVTIGWQRQWVNLFNINDAAWEGFVKKTTSKKDEAGGGVPPPPPPF